MKEKFFADKNLGQHFLKDKKIISDICSDYSDNVNSILEIGPGPGVLTETLNNLNKNLHIIEKDERFIPLLSELLTAQNVTHQDALKVSYDDFLRLKYNNDPVWIVSNLPYNISAPLTIKLMKSAQIKYMTLMFQKEVGEKFLHPPKDNKISTLSILSGIFFKTKLLLKVKPGAFHPPPKVDSVVISFQRLDEPLIPLKDFNALESLLRSLFQFKRKQIKSNLKGVLDKNSLDQLGIDEKIRAEDLTLDQVLGIYEKHL